MKRIKLSLELNGANALLGFNYEYNIGASLYRAMRAIAPKMNKELHDMKEYKGFTFSSLIFAPPFKIYSNGIFIQSRKAELIISCYDEALMPIFKEALKQIKADFYCGLSFTITAIQDLESPVLAETMRFKTVSPIFCKYSSRHLNPKSDPKIYAECLLRNLNRKKEGVNHGWIDFDYNFTLLSEPKKRGIDVKKNGINTSHLIAYEYEFEITAPLELIEIGYYQGFGSNNSMGFGCVKIIN
jgi:CRISPR-associated endoribonuclease Cas6